MRSYLDLLRDVVDNGELVDTGAKINGEHVSAISVFGRQWTHDLRNGFPLLTTKKMFWKGIVTEFHWMLSGDTNTKYLRANGVGIWDKWADENGDLGPIYGYQWRSFGGNYPKRDGIDQVDKLIEEISRLENNPNDRCRRRLIVTSWNPSQIGEMKLPPCHMLWQVGVYGEYLDLGMVMRSADIFLGVPFNIAFYALLLTRIAKMVGKMPRNLVISFHDLHLYTNHMEQAKEQLSRTCLELCELDDYDNLIGYKCHGILKGEVAV